MICVLKVLCDIISKWAQYWKNQLIRFWFSTQLILLKQWCYGSVPIPHLWWGWKGFYLLKELCHNISKVSLPEENIKTALSKHTKEGIGEENWKRLKCMKKWRSEESYSNMTLSRLQVIFSLYRSSDKQFPY